MSDPPQEPTHNDGPLLSSLLPMSNNHPEQPPAPPVVVVNVAAALTTDTMQPQSSSSSSCATTIMEKKRDRDDDDGDDSNALVGPANKRHRGNPTADPPPATPPRRSARLAAKSATATTSAPAVPKPKRAAKATSTSTRPPKKPLPNKKKRKKVTKNYSAKRTATADIPSSPSPTKKAKVEMALPPIPTTSTATVPASTAHVALVQSEVLPTAAVPTPMIQEAVQSANPVAALITTEGLTRSVAARIATAAVPGVRSNFILNDDRNAIYDYSDKGYRELNKALRNEALMAPAIQERVDALARALSKLPKFSEQSRHRAPKAYKALHEGDLRGPEWIMPLLERSLWMINTGLFLLVVLVLQPRHRILSALNKLPNPVLFRRTNLPKDMVLNVGDVYEDRAFMSTTQDEENGFPNGWRAKYLFVITENYTGVEITQFGKHHRELEVLFQPGTRFLITKINPVNGDGHIVVKMKEIAVLKN